MTILEELEGLDDWLEGDVVKLREVGGGGLLRIPPDLLRTLKTKGAGEIHFRTTWHASGAIIFHPVRQGAMN